MLSTLSFKSDRSPFKLPLAFSMPQKPAPLLRPDLLPIPVLQLSTEGLRVLSANPAAQTFFGIPAGDMDLFLRQALQPDVLVRLLIACGHTASSENLVQDCPVQLILHGVQRNLQFTVVPVDGEAAEPSVWLLIRDMTTSVPGDSWQRQCLDTAYELYGKLPHPSWVLNARNETVFSNDALLSELPVCQRPPAAVSPCSKELRERCGCGVRDGSLVAQNKTWLAMADEVRRTNAMAEKELSLGLCGSWRVMMFPLPSYGRGAPKVGAIALNQAPPVKAEVRNRLMQVQAVAQDMQDAREQERLAVAREIHDNLGQELTLLRLEMGRLLQEEVPAGATTLQPRLRALNDHLANVMTVTRRLAHELRQDSVDKHGLATAANDFVVNFRKRAELSGQLEVQEGWVEPNPEMAQHLYRSLQELLNNVAKHAGARRFAARLGMGESEYWLEVSDDGVGMPRQVVEMSAAPNGVGLRSLQERAAIYGGAVHVRTRPMIRGSTVRIVLPLKVLEVA